jgi:hypothetical protein
MHGLHQTHHIKRPLNQFLLSAKPHPPRQPVPQVSFGHDGLEHGHAAVDDVDGVAHVRRVAVAGGLEHVDAGPLLQFQQSADDGRRVAVQPYGLVNVGYLECVDVGCL